jgi:hypothetical protein
MMVMELFWDIYFIGSLIFAGHRLLTNYTLKVNPASKIKSLFSITMLAITSLLISPFWIFISWGITETDKNNKKSLKVLMGAVLILSVLNSCSVEDVNVIEARENIKEKKLSFEKIPQSNLESVNIAAYELHELINQPGVYGFIHKFGMGIILGTSKYKNIHDETAAEWRKSQNNNDFISPAERELKRQVDVISEENYQAIADGYQRLFNINPLNKTYESKYNAYTIKASDQRRRETLETEIRNCREDQEYQARQSCAGNSVDAYCGIVFMDRIIGSGCKSRLMNSGNPYQFCVDKVTEVLIEKRC